jgi:CarboxypepD_reg-like domain
MTDRNKNIIPYSTSDIEKYLKGELSARQMHDLEQTALEDPFLADAIEGLTQNPVPQQDFEELQKRLNTKVTEDKRRTAVILVRRRIAFAAAVILLLGLGYAFFRSQTKSLLKEKAAEPAAVAINTPPAPKNTQPSPTVTQPPPSSVDSTVISASIASNSTPLARSTTPAATAAKRHAIAAAPVAIEEKKFFSDSTTATLYKNSNPDRLKDTFQNKLDAETAGLTLSKAKQLKLPALNPAARRNDTLDMRSTYLSLAPNPIIYSGKVLDLQNRPVAGAFLALNGNTGFGTTTDEHGQFRLSLRRLDTTQQLTVSMIGFNHTSLDLNELNADNEKFNVIHLKPSSTNLDEVVVVGYGTHRKATEVAPPSDSDEKLDTLWINAAPVVGRQAYLQYIDASKKKLGLDTTIRGTESISFLVSRDGSLTGLKIEQSISPAHDAGIIHLVTDGPAWRIRRGRKVRASVTVNF